MSKVKLGDVAFEYKDSCKESADLPIVGLEHLIPGEVTLSHWSEQTDNTFTKRFCKGHILFGRRRAYLKKASVAPFDGICSGDITVIAAKPERLNPSLLPFIIQNDDLFAYAVEHSAGSLSPRVKWEHLQNYEFELPDYEKQTKMAETLWAIDSTTRAYKHLIEKTDEMVKSQFIELFGDPISNEKGLKVVTLKEICVGKLAYGSGAAATDYDGITRYIRITDITDTGELNDDVKSPNTIDEKYLLNDGDILFARSGNTVGKTFRYKAEHGRGIYAGFLIRLIPDTSKVLPDYVFGFTKSAFYEDFVKKTQRAVGQPNINAQEYGDLQICLPTLEEQKLFSEFMEQSDKSKFAAQQALENLQAMQKALMRKYLG